ncbi:MAG: SDR family NAD(P)-dependent oxidoreductase [Desulfobacterium sp.]|nr:SDR family NAD(P)-dependent oxidoreductase [Desulfobacterium sp.]
MEIREPEIKKQEIHFVTDDNFNPGNVCIVTGAGSGIGRATAIAVAANDLTVVGVDISEENGEMTRKMVGDMGGKMRFIRADLTRDSDMDAVVAEAATMGSVKYLANIAGIQHIDSIENFPMEKYDYMQRLMVRAPLYMSKLTMPHMKNSSDGTGVIGNMASVHAHICTLNKVSYNVAKFGLRGLTQSISAEGKGRIRGFSVSTGFVKTGLALKQIPAQAQQLGITQEQVVTDVMMGFSRKKEMMAPIEVANLFVFGFSRFANYLVGGDLLFDGGMVPTYADD